MCALFLIPLEFFALSLLSAFRLSIGMLSLPLFKRLLPSCYVCGCGCGCVCRKIPANEIPRCFGGEYSIGMECEICLYCLQASRYSNAKKNKLRLSFRVPTWMVNATVLFPHNIGAQVQIRRRQHVLLRSSFYWFPLIFASKLLFLSKTCFFINAYIFIYICLIACVGCICEK